MKYLLSLCRLINEWLAILEAMFMPELNGC